jgi:hypothetical protein
MMKNWAMLMNFAKLVLTHGGERTEFTLYGSGYFPFALNFNGARLFQTQ